MFVKRLVTLIFQLGKDSNGVRYTFQEGNYDTVTVSGLRVQANIQNSIPPMQGGANVRVHGLTPSLHNQLSRLNRLDNGQVAIRYNQLTIQAGDDQSGMSTVFSGHITFSQPDYNNAPDSSLIISAQAGYLDAIRPTPVLSYSAQADVAVIMQTLAAQAGYQFENTGVSVALSTPYLWGSPRQQMEMAARAANINWVIEKNTLAIWPKGGARGGAVPLISPSTGMIGYPSLQDQANGWSIRTLFNPNLFIGGSCKIQSSIPNANGTFQVYQLSHALESETPNGKWESSFQAQNINVYSS
jgi:hypothetical protein